VTLFCMFAGIVYIYIEFATKLLDYGIDYRQQ